ncbi:hypothetical protein AB0P32_34450, partial [Streptomyces sp. NPDC085995]|uniref:hypothetical protein n=1 Tax=Streptomyces sp. NPDC085995 TaxID=3154861 RepID=UPI0034187B63
PAVDWLAQRGYQPEYGARPLRRTIQREVDNRRRDSGSAWFRAAAVGPTPVRGRRGPRPA